MSSHSVPGVCLEKVGSHPNADRLEITHVGGYQAITQKGRFEPGDHAIYIPEQSIVPDELLKLSGFWDEEKNKGMLGGKAGNRVTPVKLRGLVSQGILLGEDVAEHYTGSRIIREGFDYAEALGIEKWSPPVPTHLAGSAVSHPGGGFSYTDIENLKKYPSVIREDEIVYMTEKLHGTCCVFHLDSDGFWVSSKGMAAKGLGLKPEESNFYWKVANNFEVEDKLHHLLSYLNRADSQDAGFSYLSVTAFAEGLGVQDLKYGRNGGDADARFFDVRVTYRDPDGTTVTDYLPLSATQFFLQQCELPMVPILYLGPFYPDVVEQFTNGKETLTGTQAHVREGVVIQPQIPREDEYIGRVILKSISPDYLLRKGEATEFE